MRSLFAFSLYSIPLICDLIEESLNESEFWCVTEQLYLEAIYE
jgi:hypothetical protein